MDAYQQRKVEITLLPYQRNQLHLNAAAFSRNAYSGAILMGLAETDVAFIEQLKVKIPLVLFNRMLDSYGSVCLDDFEIGMRAAALFHTRGHMNIGMVMPNNPSRSAQLKLSGFATGAMDYGMNLPRELVVMESQTYEGGLCAMRRLLEQDQTRKTTAIFFQEGVQAVGALRVLQEKHIHVPGDMELLSYGDNPQDAYVIPSLSSIRMPIEEMSRDCLFALMKMLEHPTEPPSTILHGFTYAFRESCGDFDGTFDRKEEAHQ